MNRYYDRIREPMRFLLFLGVVVLPMLLMSNNGAYIWLIAWLTFRVSRI